MDTKKRPLRETLEMQVEIYEGLLEEAKAQGDVHAMHLCEQTLESLKRYLANGKKRI